MKLILLIAAVAAVALAITCGDCIYNEQYACVGDLNTVCIDIPDGVEPVCPMPEMEVVSEIDSCPSRTLDCDPFVPIDPSTCCTGTGEGVSCDCSCEQVVAPLIFCYEEPTDDRTGGVVFGYEATEDATIPVGECYNYVSGTIDAGQPAEFIAGGEESSFYVPFPNDRTYVAWTVGDLTVTMDNTAPGTIPTCDSFCTGDCDACSTSAEDYGIGCIWCPDLESDDPATDGECLANFGPEEPEEICEDARYGDPPDCIFNTTGPVCDLNETCAECADVDGCVWCNADCGCVAEGDVDTECLQSDVDGVVVEDSADCRLTDAADYVDECTGIDEREALIALYDSTNGDSWTDNTGWTDDDMCNFYGVDCTAKTINLSANNLDGTIPDDFFCLSSFQHIDLTDNTLQGCIPESIGSLVGVQTLHLENNELTCDIPVTIATSLADSLQYFYVQYNRLGCEIPETFCELVFIKEFHLEVNELNGDIPECIMAPSPLAEVFEAHFECNSLTEPYDGYIDDLRAGITKYPGTDLTVPYPDAGVIWNPETQTFEDCPVF